MDQKKIFVIDDDERILQFIQRLLEERDYQVKTADKGTGAAKAIKEFLPDLILMDIMLPDIYGSELAASLKKDSKLKDIPIIFLTGLRSDKVDDDDRTKVKVGDYYHTAIAKPFDAEELLCEMRIALDKGSLDS